MSAITLPRVAIPVAGVVAGAGIGAILSDRTQQGLTTSQLGVTAVMGVGGAAVGSLLGGAVAYDGLTTVKAGMGIGALTVGAGVAAGYVAANLLGSKD